MADWKTYAKAARNTARKQAPGARDAVRRGVNDAKREAHIHSRAASKAFAEPGRKSARRGYEGAQRRLDDSRRTAVAAAAVAGRRYKQANMTSRILAALRDTTIIAVSLGAIWFVFSRIVPIPVTWVAIAIVAIVALRVISAIIHNPYIETDEDDPDGVPKVAIPESASVKKGRRGRR